MSIAQAAIRVGVFALVGYVVYHVGYQTGRSNLLKTQIDKRMEALEKLYEELGKSRLPIAARRFRMTNELAATRKDILALVDADTLHRCEFDKTFQAMEKACAF